MTALRAVTFLLFTILVGILLAPVVAILTLNWRFIAVEVVLIPELYLVGTLLVEMAKRVEVDA